MKVPISSQITGEPEAANVARVASSQHYGGGIWTDEFEKRFSEFMGARYGVFCNSGSSANLLALAALELPERSRIVTSAVNFPTTVNAIIQLGHIPVFVDADIHTLNPKYFPFGQFDGSDYDAGIFAHTLGNPVNLPKVNYPIIEDCADALGSGIGKTGVMSTVSFYPAHHMTTGEGGMVVTDSPKYKKVLESYRDWGRDCWCAPGEDNTCGRRYGGDYDHKYTYSRIGYNLKASDFQAAVGVAQLDRLPGFIQRRKYNWKQLRERLDGLPLLFMIPNGDPSWFGFPFLAEERNKLAIYLDSKGIGNRPIMAGNILRQPAYKDIEHEVIGNLDGANIIHSHGLWVGCWPGINDEMIKYVIQSFREFYK